MTAIELFALFGALAGAAVLLFALNQLWKIGGTAEAPVGPWKTAHRLPPKDPEVPREFRTLVWGETQGWQRVEQWEALGARLDRLEEELGGTPSATPWPPEYSPIGLEQRLAQLERLSGPLPSPIPYVPAIATSRKKPFWKKA